MGEVEELNENQNIGERIKLIRIDLNLNQEQFAKRLLMSPSAISAYETSQRPLPERVIQSMCSEFNINKEYLLTGKGDMFLSEINIALKQIAKHYGLDKSDMAVLLEYMNLKPQYRTIIKNSMINITSSDGFKNMLPK